MFKKIILSIFFVLVFSFNSIAVWLDVDAPGFTRCTVHADLLNVRGGPDTTFPIITTVKKGTVLKVIGKMYGWYIVQTSDNYLGMVNGWYITPDQTTVSKPSTPLQNPTNTTDSGVITLNADEKEIFDLVNEARKSAGLKELKIDAELVKIARLKAQDMADNNYFSHTSPTYGSPFDMMKNYGITYKSAGENIAGHSTAKSAFDAWMNSSGHRANILSANFNYIGIGVVPSNKYGKILVQEFIGK